MSRTLPITWHPDAIRGAVQQLLTVLQEDKPDPDTLGLLNNQWIAGMHWWCLIDLCGQVLTDLDEPEPVPSSSDAPNQTATAEHTATLIQSLTDETRWHVVCVQCSGDMKNLVDCRYATSLWPPSVLVAESVPVVDTDLRDRIAEVARDASGTTNGSQSYAPIYWDDVAAEICEQVVAPVLAERDGQLERLRTELNQARSFIGEMVLADMDPPLPPYGSEERERTADDARGHVQGMQDISGDHDVRRGSDVRVVRGHGREGGRLAEVGQPDTEATEQATPRYDVEIDIRDHVLTGWSIAENPEYQNTGFVMAHDVRAIIRKWCKANGIPVDTEAIDEPDNESIELTASLHGRPLVEEITHCSNCGQRTGMMGHPNGCPPATTPEPRVWRKGDPEPPVGTTVRLPDGTKVKRFRLEWSPTPWTWLSLTHCWSQLVEVVEDQTGDEQL